AACSCGCPPKSINRRAIGSIHDGRPLREAELIGKALHPIVGKSVPKLAVRVFAGRDDEVSVVRAMTGCKGKDLFEGRWHAYGPDVVVGLDVAVSPRQVRGERDQRVTGLRMRVDPLHGVQISGPYLLERFVAVSDRDAAEKGQQREGNRRRG